MSNEISIPDIVIALNDKADRKAVRLIKAVCKKEGFPEPTIVGNYIDVLALAVKHRRLNNKVLVMGNIDVLQADQSEEERTILLECIMLILEEHKVAFKFLDITGCVIAPASIQEPRQTIRNFYSTYTTILKKINTTIQLLDATGEGARHHGRPPYGYQQPNGVLMIRRPHAAAVRTIVISARKGSTPGEILADVKARHPMDRNKKAFWDYRKLLRVRDNLKLYCLGTYKSGSEMVTLPNLAFLPAEWVDTQWPKPRPSRSK